MPWMFSLPKGGTRRFYWIVITFIESYVMTLECANPAVVRTSDERVRLPVDGRVWPHFSLLFIFSCEWDRSIARRLFSELKVI